MKKFIGATIPFFLFHIVCCGGLLIFLTASGLLLTMKQEGTNKYYLIPALLLSALFIFLYNRHNKACHLKGGKTFSDHLISISLYLIFSMILGFIFMIYIFIPWWIPGYKGGFLLP